MPPARILRGLVAAIVLAATAPAGAQASDHVVRSFDGTPIVMHFFQAAGLHEGQRAATVLVGPGWGNPGDPNPESTSDLVTRVGVGMLRHAGYNVVTWDPRGFGFSGGVVRFDSIDYEARDVMALIDFVSRRPEARLDGPGDPRVGMAGTSYGGGIQFVSAARDPRIDAIVPVVAWHSLITSFYKDATLKTGWLAAICSGGPVAATTYGLFSPVGTQAGGVDSHVADMCTTGIANGRLSPATEAWLASRGPGDATLARVHAPTLLIQGTDDTLLPLDEAIANYRALHVAGVPVRMMWFCGGHGLCSTPRGPNGYVDRAIERWFARYLDGQNGVNTGPPFEWIDQHGAWHHASAYPLAPDGALTSTGSGGLAFTPLDSLSSGVLLAASPSRRATSLDLPHPGAPAELVGEPRLDLTYTGRASRRYPRVFAQIVDLDRNAVVGGLATPIPLVLDGGEHTITRPLEVIAQHVTPASRYELQIVPGTLLYDGQRAFGKVNFSRIRISLPLGKDPAPMAHARTNKNATSACRHARAGARGKARGRATRQSRRRLRACRARKGAGHNRAARHR